MPEPCSKTTTQPCAAGRTASPHCLSAGPFSGYCWYRSLRRGITGAVYVTTLCLLEFRRSLIEVSRGTFCHRGSQHLPRGSSIPDQDGA